ncbi:MAG: FG-GAP-like repeat-containing protein [Planctomycetaceae bacterium]
MLEESSLQAIRRRFWGPMLIASLAIAGAGKILLTNSPVNQTELLKSARRELARGNYTEAESLALAAAQSEHHCDPWTWMVAAESAYRSNRPTDALVYYSKVTQGSPDLLSAAAHGRAEMQLQLDRLTEAEKSYLASMDFDPGNLLARRRLADLYNMTGRRNKAIPLMESLIGTTSGTLDDLFYLGDVDHGVQVPDHWKSKTSDSKTDPIILFAVGCAAMAENKNEEALQCLERAAQQLPDNADVVAATGQIMAQLPGHNSSAWRDLLTDSLRQNSGVLASLGLHFENARRQEDSVEAYARAAAGQPQSRIAWHRLGQSLSRTGRKREAETALGHAQKLQQLAHWLDDLFEHREQTELVRRIVIQMSELGRREEAIAWCHYAIQIKPQNDWASGMLTELQQRVTEGKTNERNQTLSMFVKNICSTTWNPDLKQSTGSAGKSAEKNVPPTTSFRFTDEAASTGLVFTHLSARDSSRKGARIIETTGGGAGIIDLDSDSWPDVYFPQGAASFPIPDSNPDGDQLFRNLRGKQWLDCSAVAEIRDANFSQGIAVGDVNNDGFQDLYVANYGFNRLLLNLGDGTFADVTPDSIRTAFAWTTSCLIADLNSDGNPDLFDVTYCKGDNVTTLICEQNGVPRSCSPRAFEADDDRLWLSSGDGNWQPAAEESLSLPDGLGLGVIAFRPAADRPLSLFIANDEAPNFWMVPVGSDAAGDPVFEELAAVSGLAVDADGKPQACMGIAADDMNHDGLIDLFVTNFFRESNTLYTAISTDFYEDHTRTSGLREPSWNMLGFGTQFLDADLDGSTDLFVANGHIDQLSRADEPFEMPAQFFRNNDGLFEEVNASEPLRPALGRAAAKLDWNRDGREDLVIANQYSPAQLLTNETAQIGRSLVFQFRATSSSRDGIGTIIQLKSGSGTITKQLTAGDGYMASNERQLVITLGSSETIESVTIFWPGGLTQTLTASEFAACTLIVEQRPWAAIP